MPPRIPVITSLHFSTNGQHLLVGTAGDVHYIIDSFDGKLLRRLVGHEGLERAGGHSTGMVPEAGISGQEVSWTPDGRFVLSGESTSVVLMKALLAETLCFALTGSASGQIFVWDVPPNPPNAGDNLNLQPCAVLPGHAGPSRVVAFNPRTAREWKYDIAEQGKHLTDAFCAASLADIHRFHERGFTDRVLASRGIG